MNRVYKFLLMSTLMFTKGIAQPIAKPDIIYFDSGKTDFNLLLNDSNAYKIIEYSTLNSKGVWTRYVGNASTVRKVSYFGSLKLRTDGIGYFEPNKNTPDTLLIHYTISDWKSGTSQTSVYFIRKKPIPPYLGRMRILNYPNGAIILHCDSVFNGRQYALLTSNSIGTPYLYGYIEDTSYQIEVKWRFLMKGDIIYSTYPYSQYPYTVSRITWSAHLTREQYYYIKYEACK